jgi:hypothetical protein
VLNKRFSYDFVQTNTKIIIQHSCGVSLQAFGLPCNTRPPPRASNFGLVIWERYSYENNYIYMYVICICILKNLKTHFYWILFNSTEHSLASQQYFCQNNYISCLKFYYFYAEICRSVCSCNTRNACIIHKLVYNININEWILKIVS